MSIINDQAIFLQDASKLIQFAASLGFTVTGGELYRTPEQQQVYYEKGLSKTTKGQHINRCAIDLNFFRLTNGKFEAVTVPKDLSEIGKFWLSLDPKNDCGIRWGWDTYHFERKA